MDDNNELTPQMIEGLHTQHNRAFFLFLLKKIKAKLIHLKELSSDHVPVEIYTFERELEVTTADALAPKMIAFIDDLMKHLEKVVTDNTNITLSDYSFLSDVFRLKDQPHDTLKLRFRYTAYQCPPVDKKVSDDE